MPAPQQSIQAHRPRVAAIPIVLHRVHAWGASSPHPLHEHADAGPCHDHALEQSKAHPLQKFEVRGAPQFLRATNGELHPNEGLQKEIVIAVYQNGKQLPIT